MKVAIASDHAGFSLKTTIIKALKEMEVTVLDLGPADDKSVDYPQYGAKVAQAVARAEADFGIALCGSGIGISMAANKVAGIRCALCNEPLSAKLAREHNDANVLAIGARLVGETMALQLVKVFLATEFRGGRHQKRVAMLDAMIDRKER